jgi:hypothetical protein
LPRYDGRIVKRWLLRICVFLLLAAIINVAVAWTAWLLPRNTGETTPDIAPSAVDVRWWDQNAPSGFGGPPTSKGEFRSFGRSEGGLALTRWNDADSTAVPNTINRFRAGWPVLAMEGAKWFDRSDWHKHEMGVLHPPAGWPLSKKGFPCRPIWPGFAISTVFYAFVLWLLFAGPFVVRRWRRIRRGLCPKCAYDLRGTPEGATACPECGWRRAPESR